VAASSSASHSDVFRTECILLRHVEFGGRKKCSRLFHEFFCVAKTRFVSTNDFLCHSWSAPPCLASATKLSWQKNEKKSFRYFLLFATSFNFLPQYRNSDLTGSVKCHRYDMTRGLYSSQLMYVETYSCSLKVYCTRNIKIKYSRVSI
jgi:hypothetical protein